MPGFLGVDFLLAVLFLTLEKMAGIFKACS